MVTVVPAIIPDNFNDLKQKIELVYNYVTTIQIDVFDGTFSPSINWPYVDEGDSYYAQLKTGDLQIPHSNKIDFEIDATITNPERVVDDWINAGARSIIAHIEGTNNMRDIIYKCRERKTKIGIALLPSTTNEALEPYRNDIDFVQLMGNDKVGYHNVPLDKNIFKKIKSLREMLPRSTIIGIDIGVNRETAPLLIRAGAGKLVSGSAIYGSDNIKEAIKMLSLSDTK